MNSNPKVYDEYGTEDSYVWALCQYPDIVRKFRDNILSSFFKNQKHRDCVSYILERYDKSGNKTTPLPLDVEKTFKGFQFLVSKQFYGVDEEKRLIEGTELFLSNNYRAHLYTKLAWCVSQQKEEDVIRLTEELKQLDALFDQTEEGPNVLSNPFSSDEDLDSAMRDIDNRIPSKMTGFPDFDACTGGLRVGQMSIFAGPTGGGKSLILQNLAVNFASTPEHVLFLSLELDLNQVNERLFAMISEVNPKLFIGNNLAQISVKKRIKDYFEKKKAEHNGEKVGDLTIRKVDMDISASQVKACVEMYKSDRGFYPTVLIIDYIDLIRPSDPSISFSEVWTKDKVVAEELCKLAQDTNSVLITASQLTKSSYESGVNEFNLSLLSGGIAKANTASLVVGLRRGENEYVFTIMKNRNSSADTMVKIAYNPDCMRLSNQPAVNTTFLSSSGNKLGTLVLDRHRHGNNGNGNGNVDNGNFSKVGGVATKDVKSISSAVTDTSRMTVSIELEEQPVKEKVEPVDESDLSAKAMLDMIRLRNKDRK